MISIKKNLKDSYNFYLSKFTVIVGVTAIIYFLSVLFDNVVESLFSISLIMGILTGVLIGVIKLIIEIGYLKYILKLISGGFPTLEDLLKYTYLFWRYLFGGLLFAIVVIVGLALLIIPGIYLALRFIFVPIILIDKETTIKEAFKKSTEITNGVKWKLLGLFIILGLIQALISVLLSADSGQVIYGAGFVLVSPYLFISYIKAYRSLQGLDS